jgi:type IV pilus assembly protein PilC
MSRTADRALIVLFLHLEQMEKAGVPIAQSLATARDAALTKKIHNAVDGVLHQVKQGHTLTEAMSFYPDIFDETNIRLVAVGEKGGKMARAYGLCLEYIRRRDEHARFMRKATRQPKISLAIILALAAFRGHTLLPWAAFMIVTVSAAFWALRRFVMPFRYITDRMFVGSPILGPFVAQDSWARFAHSLSMLYEAGVDMRSGLMAAAATIPNLVIRDAAEDAIPRVINGASIHAAFREGGRMDKMALAMLKAGEDTGNFGRTLRELAEYYEKSTADALTALQQFSGPVLTIITGGVLYLGL